jgi:hypothetical protein
LSWTQQQTTLLQAFDNWSKIEFKGIDVEVTNGFQLMQKIFCWMANELSENIVTHADLEDWVRTSGQRYSIIGEFLSKDGIFLKLFLLLNYFKIYCIKLVNRLVAWIMLHQLLDPYPPKTAVYISLSPFQVLQLLLQE